LVSAILARSGCGIPVGKLSLYTACAGVHPGYCLPITLDVGTENASLHAGEAYIGLKEKRARGQIYDDFIEEFVTAVKTVFPRALLQWEDFGNTNAFRLLGNYRKRLPSFNDDIQGTASVAIAGVLGALRLTGSSLAQQKLLFLGAGEAGTGIADLYVAAAVAGGMSVAEARSRCWFVDSKGLVVKNRGDHLAAHKEHYAHDHPFVATLAEAVKVLKPTALIGVSGTPATFTKEIVEEMGRHNPRPIIFALSNPTSKAECTGEQAYTWSEGRAIFASGSPFAPVVLNGRTHVPGQGNNVYIFPGVGLGALTCEATEVTDAMFLAAAQTLAGLVQAEDLAQGRVYPPLTKIREVSLKIATAVAECAYAAGLARAPRPDDIGSRRARPDVRAGVSRLTLNLWCRQGGSAAWGCGPAFLRTDRVRRGGLALLLGRSLGLGRLVECGDGTGGIADNGHFRAAHGLGGPEDFSALGDAGFEAAGEAGHRDHE